MTSNKKSDKWDDIIRNAEARDCSTAEFLARFQAGTDELREAISFLMRRRELLRDSEIEQLEQACGALMDQLADLKRKILLEELACFKDVMALYRTLHQANGAP